jgi:hypothetical protein
MADDDGVRAAEAEVDAAFSDSALLKAGYAQAVWTLLSFTEDAYLKALHEATKSHDIHMHVDNQINALTYPLRACHRGNPDGMGLRTEYIDGDYKLAWDWLEAADDYSQFCTIFPLWHRQRIGLHVDGTRLVVDHRDDRQREYEAYNRLVRNEAKPDVEAPPMPDRVSRLLGSALRAKEGSFHLHFNPLLTSALIAWLGPVFATRHTLPEDWAFKGFSLRDFRKIFSTIQALMFAWHTARQIAADAGMSGMGYPSAVWVVPHDELFARLARYTGVSKDALKVVLDLLTFGSNGIREPDIATQPLIDLRNGTYALSPFVWLNSAVERNLCALVNQIPEQRSIYSALTDTKEAATRADIIGRLTPHGFSFAYGNVTGTDVDLAIIDHERKVCLCLQLKWFIEPAEVREIRERTQDLADGVRQAKIVNALHAKQDGHFWELF